MSYSFNVKAATKDEAKAAVVVGFDQVVANQPVHAADKAAVLANANTIIDLLGDNDAKDISVSCNGWVQWQSTSSDGIDTFTGVSVGCTASHVDRQIAA
jgi:hypothetical protein